MNRPLTLVVALALATVLGCTAAPPADPPGTVLARADVARAAATADDATAAAAAVNAFGLDLHRTAAAEGNLVLSPVSIAFALGMARPGARGDTAAEMDAVLHGAAADANAEWLNALEQAIAGRSRTVTDQTGEEREVTLRIANAPFAHEGMALETPYLQALGARFGEGVRLVDFVAKGEEARNLINEWVSGRTERRIPELLQGELDPLTRLILVNAVYLKAPWLLPFDAAATRPAPFTLPDGSTVAVPTMSRSPEAFPYAEGDGWRAVELPYIGNQLAMTIVVPDHLERFESGLSPDLLAALTNTLEPRPVRLTLPRFEIETRQSLRDVLAGLGMGTAFDPYRADFSGINGGEEQLFVADVIHQANIEVSEAGTEAAAATAVIVQAAGAPLEPVELRVDRPFLFALRDVGTGAILFLGRVVNPEPSPAG